MTTTNDSRLRARLGIAPADVVVGKIARLFKLKGHDDLFAIAPSILHEYPGIKFLLVGGGEWQQRFQERARELGIADKVIFTGLVPPSEIPALIGIMDIVVHLSRREGLPRALPQALAAARPVIAYDCDGAGEVCINDTTGLLIKSGDLSALQHAILRLARDPGLRERLGRQGQMLVQQSFSIERMVDDIYALYRQLARERDLRLS